MRKAEGDKIYYRFLPPMREFSSMDGPGGFGIEKYSIKHGINKFL
jgi:hypothetical protein